MKSLFSNLPSDALIEKAVLAIGFDSLADTKEVEESMIRYELVEEVRAAMAFHYYPCFRRQFLDAEDFDYKSLVTMVRQLLRLKGRKLIRRETSEKVGRGVYRYTSRYRLDFSPAGCCEVTFR